MSAAYVRVGWFPGGPFFETQLDAVIRYGRYIGMSGEFSRSHGMERVWVDYAYPDDQSARWDAARVVAAAQINGWPGVWAEWSPSDGSFRPPTTREVERMLRSL